MARIKYGLLGMSLPYTLSPQIHALLGNNSYKVVELQKNTATEFISLHRFKAINVTYPYKRLAAALCDSLSDSSQATGVVNTLLNDDGVLEGFNTDISGFFHAFERFGIVPKNPMILGSGATCSSIRHVLLRYSPESITVVSRNGEINYSNCAEYKNTDVIINTTPVGTYPDIYAKPNISLSDFPKLKFVFDVVYNPVRSSLLLEAESLGIPCCNGLYMLCAQAHASDMLFFGKENDMEHDELFGSVWRKSTNLYISGMPGSGKTRFGKLLSKKLETDFHDTDEEIESVYHAKPEEIIEKRGEEYFRNAESAVINRLCALKGITVSLGGGAILREENVSLMKRSGYIIQLGREISKLSLKNRPLTQTSGAEKLYEQRRFAYECSRDVYVFNNEDDESTLKALYDAVQSFIK